MAKSRSKCANRVTQEAAVAAAARAGGGPKTPAGRARSSANALTHGATSPTLLNDDERARYQSFLSALRAHYPSANPLVQMQLERIARLKVQLERIQDVVDASFVVERLAMDDFERACGVLNLTQAEQSQMAGWLLHRFRTGEPDSILEPGLVAVATELAAVDEFRLLTTHGDFARCMPVFCDYIVEQANQRDESLATYLSTRQLGASELSQPPPVRVRLVGFWCEVAPEPRPELSDVSVEVLQLSAAWFRRQTWEFLRGYHRIREAGALMESAVQAAVPKPEKLDHLMRYQTTINRQLSSAMGELLVLLK